MFDVAELFRTGENELTELEGDGDFRSPECLALLDEADIVVTNPPFSLFREYVATLMEHDKKFIIIGNQNAITYKEIFPYIRDNKMRLGYGFNRNCAHFVSPYHDIASDLDHKEGMIRVSGVMWYTNLDISTRFVDFDTVRSEMEDNADSFARNALIKPEHYKRLLEAGNYHDLAYIKRFAQYEGVPHWIVIGRLHSDEWLVWSYFANEIPRFEWAS